MREVFKEKEMVAFDCEGWSYQVDGHEHIDGLCLDELLDGALQQDVECRWGWRYHSWTYHIRSA